VGGDEADDDETIGIQEALKGVCDTALACGDPLSADPGPSAFPDLAGSPFYRGTPAQRAVTVLNRGTAAAPASSTSVDIGWGCRQHVPTPAIAADTTVQVNVTLPDRCYRAGATMTIVVDEYQAVSESDETNNTRTYVFGSLSGTGTR